MAPPGGPSAVNMEYKVFDATANVYIGVAALLCAGMEGLKAGKSLPAALDEDPGSLTEEARSSRAVKRLPATMGDALKATNADTGVICLLVRLLLDHNGAVVADLVASLEKGLGAPLLKVYTAVKRAEVEYYMRLSSPANADGGTAVGLLYDKF